MKLKTSVRRSIHVRDTTSLNRFSWWWWWTY